MSDVFDAVVVGSGPNGLAAAITLAREGCSVLVVEARESVGGGTRTAEVTLPGFLHDLCAAIHPLTVASPFFRSLPLDRHGLEWIYPPADVAHPLDGGRAVLMVRSVDETARQLGPDAAAYRALIGRLARVSEELLPDVLAPLHLPKHPLLLSGFGLKALQSAAGLARRRFGGPEARALFAGCAAHAIQPLSHMATAAVPLMMAMLSHTVGWPLARGGTGNVTAAMAAYLTTLRGHIQTGWHVKSIDELPPARAYLFDITPRQMLQIAGHRLPAGYRRQLERYRYGPGTFKVDLALDGPIPWQNEAVSRAATVHVGGTLEEVAASEQAAWDGVHSDRPFVLVAQQSLFDPSRAPAGKHTAWAYCHVPHGSSLDMTEKIESQIERFAPGFRERILARSTRNAVQTEQYNPNWVGGDINGGVQDIRQLFTRPVLRLNPYTTPARDLFFCSSATPPGGGVHGLCGYYAARAAMKSALRQPQQEGRS